MASRRPGRLRSAFGAAFMGLLAVGMTSFAPPTAHRGSGRPTPAHAVDSVVVRRMDLDTTLLAGGDLMPSKQTTVTCEVEDVDRGPYGGGDAGTLILSIVPNGAAVKKGDVLCVLDSSGFLGTGAARADRGRECTGRPSPGRADPGDRQGRPARVPGGYWSLSERRSLKPDRPCSIPISSASAITSPGPTACSTRGTSPADLS